MTLFEALTGGAFDRLNWQHSGKFDKNFSKKSNAWGFAPGGGGCMGGFGIDRYIILLSTIHIIYSASIMAFEKDFPFQQSYFGVIIALF